MHRCFFGLPFLPLLFCRAFLVAQPSTKSKSLIVLFDTEESPRESSDTSRRIDGERKDLLPCTAIEKAEAETLRQQALALRAEADSMRAAMQAAKEQQLQKETAAVDRWIEHLLVNLTIDENTQMLNTVDQVTQLLQDGRFSQEQVNKIFKRICETGPATQSRSNCSPIMSLLVDAAGKLDCVEREDNPNKRWSGRVERLLRKKLFALDWGMEIEDDDDPFQRPGRFL